MAPLHHHLLLTLFSTTTALSLPRQTTPQPPPCTRSSLLLAADAYVASQTLGSLSPLAPFLAATWTYEQNNLVLPSPTNPTTSVLTKPLPIDHRRTITDTVQCATYTELISVAGQGYVIGTQIRHQPGEGGKIVYIDSIASTTGSWLFNATKTLAFAQGETWDRIPEGARDAREVIQAAGDAYLDLWSDGGAAARVPWGTPCARLEGGAYTGKGRADDSCKAGIPADYNQAPNTRRRYVVDEEMGSVSILCVWEHMMMAADGHEFRLEGGKLRYVHTMTECGGRTCKL
ncbi:hypothetical protein QBC39DRAFT_177808 [Podospora conica]|nr:hypothetical protein QBC39DRAFT_177808 [Schizothecium conicum]